MHSAAIFRTNMETITMVNKPQMLITDLIKYSQEIDETKEESKQKRINS